MPSAILTLAFTWNILFRLIPRQLHPFRHQLSRSNNDQRAYIAAKYLKPAKEEKAVDTKKGGPA